MSHSETPIGLALIPCDCIIEDKKTSKKSLIGIFGNINVSALPCPMPPTCILVSMTGGAGEYLCEVICDAPAPGSEQVFSMKGKIRFDTPQQILDFVFQIKSGELKEPGVYWLKVLIDEVPIMMRPFSVNLLKDNLA